MRIGVITVHGETISLVVSPEMKVEVLKNLVETETGVLSELQVLMYGELEMWDGMELGEIGIHDGAAIIMSIRSLASSSSSFSSSREESIVPYSNEQVNESPYQHFDEWRKGISENMNAGLEYNPEGFAKVTMLFINLHVNDVPIKAFIDTGAQMTVMTTRCVQRCGLSGLIDTRFEGVARGVGSARVLGKIHFVPLKIGSLICPCAFTVMEMADMDMILGLDMLLKHDCAVDLKNNVLRVGSSSVVPFLPEKDIPR